MKNRIILSVVLMLSYSCSPLSAAKSSQDTLSQTETACKSSQNNEFQKSTFYFGSELSNSRWLNKKIEIYYDSANQPSGISLAQAENIFLDAISKWSADCGVQITYKGLVNSNGPDWCKAVIISWYENIGSGIFGNVSYCKGGTLEVGKSGASLMLEKNLGNNLDVIQRVFLHELGHVIGLHHDTEQNSVMTASLGLFTTPQQNDYDGCKALYGVNEQNSPISSPNEQFACQNTNSR